MNRSMIQFRIKTITIVLLMLIENLTAFTVVDHYPNDDCVIEHQVSYDEAIAEARNLNIPTGPIPGCTACTYDEMTYCKDGSVINDHCCCEGAYNKVFPFVEHTCRTGRNACKVIAAHCAEYTRLRECCCHAYLGSVWKYRAGGVASVKPCVSTIAGILSMLYLLHIGYFKIYILYMYVYVYIYNIYVST